MGLLFKINPTSHNMVFNFSYFIRNNTFVLLTNLSKNPPYHGASGKFAFQSTPILLTNSFVSTDTKFFPESGMILLGQPRLLINLRKLLMNEYKFSMGARSKMIPRLAAHVYSVTQFLFRVIELSLIEMKIGFIKKYEGDKNYY